MSERNHLKEFNDRIPEVYRGAGWRVMAIASGRTFAGDDIFFAVLQNDADPAGNGYFNSSGRTKEEAVERSVSELILNVSLPENN